MPQIRPYTQQEVAAGAIPTRAAQPSTVGESIFAVGRSLEQIADVQREQQERQDVADVHVKLADARSRWTVYLQEKADKTTPGDATFAESYAKELSDYVGKLRDGVRTQAGQRAFAQLSAQMTGNLVERAGIYQAKSVGQKAKADYLVSLDRSRNTLLSDPTQFDTVVAQAIAAIDDPAGQYARLPEPARAELVTQTRKELAASQVQGVILSGAPELAKRQLAEGRYDAYLDADKKAELMASAETGIRAKDVEARRLEAERKDATKQQHLAIESQFIARIYDPQSNGGRLSTKDVLASPLEATRKEHFLRLMETRAKEAAEKPIKTVPSVMLSLFDDIRSGRMATTKPIEDRYLAGQVSFEDMNRLRKEFTDMRTPEGEKFGQKRKAFYDGIKPQIDKSNPLMGKLDPGGAQKFYEFQDYVERQVEAYRAEKKNPYDLFDPSKPAYLGKPEVIAGFQKTIRDSMAEVARRTSSAPRSAPLPRLEGETPEQWLARKGGAK